MYSKDILWQIVDWINRAVKRDKIRALLRMSNKISGIAKWWGGFLG
jgi:hypothetical protein